MTLIQLQNENRFFVHLFDWDEVLHKQGDFTVDREYYSEMKKSFLFLTASPDRPPQYPPIKRQHGDDGFVYGVVVDVFSTDERTPPPGFTAEGLYLEVVPSPWLAQRHGVDGLIRDWSPGVQDEWKDPHTGTVLKNVLREASFVSEGHLKNTEKQSPAYALSADGFVTTTTKKEAVLAEESEEETTENEPTQLMDEDAADLAARVSSLEKGQSEIATQLQRLTTALESDDTEDEEETELADDKDKEMAALKEGQDELRKELQAERTLRLQAQANAAINEAGLELEDGDRESLLSLAISDADAFNSTVKLLSAKESTIRELSATEPANPFAFKEVGNMGGPAPEPKPLGNFRKLCAEVKESGITSQLKAIDTLSSKKALNLMDDSDMAAKGPILDEFFPSN